MKAEAVCCAAGSWVYKRVCRYEHEPQHHAWRGLLLNHDSMLGCRVPESDVEKKGQGYVLSADPGVAVSARAHKMSKSRGNVVNPDDVVDAYGADSLRLYEMFMGPLRDTKVGSWTTRISGHITLRVLPLIAS